MMAKLIISIEMEEIHHTQNLMLQAELLYHWQGVIENSKVRVDPR
jgi:hypothetical protein